MVGHELGVNNASVAVGAGYLAPDALGPGLVNVYHLLAVPALVRLGPAARRRNQWIQKSNQAKEREGGEVSSAQ